MDKSYHNILSCSSINYDQNNFNDEENSLNSYNNSINNKNEGIIFKLDCIETGISDNNNEILNDNIRALLDNKPKQKLIGRKKENSRKKDIHDKYAGDNIIKKIKSILLNCLFNFINLVIKNKYNGNIGDNLCAKQLVKINKDNILSSKYSKLLLNKTLKEIFSGKKHNEDLIEQLLNEKDEEKRDFFNKLFNLTFVDCLNHLREEYIKNNKLDSLNNLRGEYIEQINGLDSLKLLRGEYIEQLNGLDSLEKILEKFKDDKDYIYNFKYYFFNFEELMKRKRSKVK